jgi:hypothetical protein
MEEEEDNRRVGRRSRSTIIRDSLARRVAWWRNVMFVVLLPLSSVLNQAE